MFDEPRASHQALMCRFAFISRRGAPEFGVGALANMGPVMSMRVHIGTPYRGSLVEGPVNWNAANAESKLDLPY